MIQRRLLVEADHPTISVRRQCELLGVNRSSYYYQPLTVCSEFDQELMQLIDKEYTEHPFYGSRRMREYLHGLGYQVNRKHIQRLMRQMGIAAIYPKPRTSMADQENRIYPYLLRGYVLSGPNEVWSADITYLPMHRGFMYLCTIIDWYSRYVLAYRLSTTMDVSFCVEALEEALRWSQPKIFNTDQGSQFTSGEFVGRLEAESIAVSMDGRGRCHDNIFIERLWRSLKYEEIYLREYADGLALQEGVGRYFRFYNDERPHQSLNYQTPRQVHFGII